MVWFFGLFLSYFKNKFMITFYRRQNLKRTGVLGGSRFMTFATAVLITIPKQFFTFPSLGICYEYWCFYSLRSSFWNLFLKMLKQFSFVIWEIDEVFDIYSHLFSHRFIMKYWFCDDRFFNFYRKVTDGRTIWHTLWHRFDRNWGWVNGTWNSYLRYYDPLNKFFVLRKQFNCSLPMAQNYKSTLFFLVSNCFISTLKVAQAEINILSNLLVVISISFSGSAKKSPCL